MIKSMIKQMKCNYCEYEGPVDLFDDEPTECPACGHCYGLHLIYKDDLKEQSSVIIKKEPDILFIRHQSTVIKEAYEIISQILDKDECQLDHHGHCQSHGWTEKTECPHAKARKWLLVNKDIL